MSTLKGRTLFFTTSPRTPLKMLPEIKALISQFEGKAWNKSSQVAYMRYLAQEECYEGIGSQNDMDLSARDRINRGPKALGFVDIKPFIALTAAGKVFLDEASTEEILLRQLLKFQLPSPFHKQGLHTPVQYCVKPYLEMFRLINTLGTVSFDELMIFGMQLIDYHDFDCIVEKIKKFRADRKASHENYKNFMGRIRKNEIESIYAQDIQTGNTQTRESQDTSIKKFIDTKASNQRDYADACFRYLRATGLVAISQKGHSLSIIPEKQVEVDYFLNTASREPCYINSEKEYKEYLFSPLYPELYFDNRNVLVNELSARGLLPTGIIDAIDIKTLKQLLKKGITDAKENSLTSQVSDLKNHQNDADVLQTFEDIKQNKFYDVPLMLEWNTWRAMTILDGGNIKANLKFDDAGQPMSTASGNMADIVCEYEDFSLTVEVTMQSGQRQYEMEGEPVSRHLANLKKSLNGKSAYCLFIAPKINEACVAHFFTLHKTNISYYGGCSVIIPLELDTFKQMVKTSSEASFPPPSQTIKEFCEFSKTIAQTSANEVEWYTKIRRIRLFRG